MTEFDLDFSEIEEKYKVEIPTTFDNIVVVDGAPIVDEKKEEKLMKLIKKVFSAAGTIKEEGIFMPKNDDGNSKGFLFIQYETEKEAKNAIKTLDKYKVDKNHTLRVSSFDDVESYLQIPEEYVEPEIDEFKPKEHLKHWLNDLGARDQFAMVKGDDVGIYWNNKSENPERVKSQSNWSDRHIQWSSLGSYLVTIHYKGVALWGGPNFEKINRYVHPNVNLVDFSPNEKYMVTWSFEPFKSPEGHLHNICVWDVLTGEMLRSFPSPKNENDKQMKPGMPFFKSDWPLLKWSHDDAYVARMNPGKEGVLYVYQLPSMGLLDKKSIKIENLMDFHWSPSDNIISYWTPEIGNIPARATLINIPTRHIVRTKNFFGVLDCKIYWQPSGDYMIVKVDRNKTKTTTVTSFEVFRMKEKDIPVDVLELKPTQIFSDLFWEPKGNKFAVLANENNNNNIFFFEVQANNQSSASAAEVKLLKKIDAKGINTIKWSPKGRFCVLGGSKSGAGDLFFWDVEELIMMGQGEHYGFSGVEWDPTGRYVASYVSSFYVQNDHGVVIWSLIGTDLLKTQLTGLKQFIWRPRPKTILPASVQKQIRKNLKEYSKEFDEEDLINSNKASSEVQEKRRAQLAEYKEFMAKFEERKEIEKEERIELFGYDPYEPEGEEFEEIEVIEVIEQVVE